MLISHLLVFKTSFVPQDFFAFELIIINLCSLKKVFKQLDTLLNELTLDDIEFDTDNPNEIKSWYTFDSIIANYVPDLKEKQILKGPEQENIGDIAKSIKETSDNDLKQSKDVSKIAKIAVTMETEKIIVV